MDLWLEWLEIYEEFIDILMKSGRSWEGGILERRISVWALQRNQEIVKGCADSLFFGLWERVSRFPFFRAGRRIDNGRKRAVAPWTTNQTLIPRVLMQTRARARAPG